MNNFFEELSWEQEEKIFRLMIALEPLSSEEQEDYQLSTDTLDRAESRLLVIEAKRRLKKMDLLEASKFEVVLPRLRSLSPEQKRIGKRILARHQFPYRLQQGLMTILLVANVILVFFFVSLIITQRANQLDSGFAFVSNR